MSISVNYPQPITVNGFSCKNCTDVDYAKKHIDPAHPKSGPYGVNAKTDPTVKHSALDTTDAKSATDGFIKFGGHLSQPSATGSSASAPQSQPTAGVIASTAQVTSPGQSVNLLA